MGILLHVAANAAVNGLTESKYMKCLRTFIDIYWPLLKKMFKQLPNMGLGILLVDSFYLPLLEYKT